MPSCPYTGPDRPGGGSRQYPWPLRGGRSVCRKDHGAVKTLFIEGRCVNSMMAVLYLFLLVNVMVAAAQADSATGEKKQGVEVLRFQLFWFFFYHESVVVKSRGV